MISNLPPNWHEVLGSELNQDYFKKLTQFLENERQAAIQVYPDGAHVLRALQHTHYSRVRVVILGQDPYHGEGQAIGLSFGVPNEMQPKPPSLRNIFKELSSDLDLKIHNNQSDLTGWADQGVLLLNTVLTVRAGQAFSHSELGWERFTDQVISKLNQRSESVIFVLWGASAQKKKSLITEPRHFILEAPHPSPLSAYRGFFGSKPFSKMNQVLVNSLGQKPIDWSRISNS